MESIYYIGLYSLFNSLRDYIHYVAEFLALISNSIGLGMFQIDGIKLKRFIKTIKYASCWNGELPANYIIGKYYIGYVTSRYDSDSNKTSSVMSIFTSKKFFIDNIMNSDSLIDDDDDNSDSDNEKTNTVNNQKHITYISGDIGRFEMDIHRRKIPHTKYAAKPHQKKIIDDILDMYNTKKYATVLISGSSGIGKSMISLLLSKEMSNTCEEVFLIDNYNPVRNGFKFDNLHREIDPKINSPFIVVIDEVDALLKDIHLSNHIKNKMYDRVIKQNDNKKSSVDYEIGALYSDDPKANKADWNLFLDRFDRFMFPHVIVIMTTNQSLEKIDEMDVSYLREGRIGLKYTVTKVGTSINVTSCNVSDEIDCYINADKHTICKLPASELPVSELPVNETVKKSTKLKQLKKMKKYIDATNHSISD